MLIKSFPNILLVILTCLIKTKRKHQNFPLFSFDINQFLKPLSQNAYVTQEMLDVFKNNVIISINHTNQQTNHQMLRMFSNMLNHMQQQIETRMNNNMTHCLGLFFQQFQQQSQSSQFQSQPQSQSQSEVFPPVAPFRVEDSEIQNSLKSLNEQNKSEFKNEYGNGSVTIEKLTKKNL